MSRGATLSVLGLYNNDSTIFDLMAFPDGFTAEQKQITRDNILVECAELEFLYPAPAVAKSLIGIWSKKEKPYWDRVYAASQAEYNPIENYRRNETETIGEEKTEEHSGNDVNRSSGTDTDSRTGTETLNKTGTETLDKSGTETLAKTGTDTSRAGGSDTQSGSSESTDTHSGSDVVDNSITGYDSNTLVPHDESETTYGHVIANEAEGSNTTTYGRTDTITHNTEDETTFDTEDQTTYNTQDQTTLNTLETFVHGKTDTLTHGEKIEHEGTTERTVLAYGNIGVTTSQEMLTQELELAKIINVIPIIIESFKERFCIMVY